MKPPLHLLTRWFHLLPLLALLLGACSSPPAAAGSEAHAYQDTSYPPIDEGATLTAQAYPGPTLPYPGPATETSVPTATTAPTQLGQASPTVTRTLPPGITPSLPAGATPSPAPTAGPPTPLGTALFNLPGRGTRTPTPIPSPTASPTPTPTPTSPFLVGAGTPLPLPLAAITANNAGLVSALAEWQEPAVSDLAWSPDGALLAVATGKGIELYDLQTRRKLRSLYPHREGVVALSFSPDGAWLAAAERLGSPEAGYASYLEFWLGPYWQPVGIFLGVARGISTLSFSPDSKFLATAYSSPTFGDDTIELRLASTFEVTRTLKIDPGLDLAFSPDGKTLAATPDRYSIRAWNLKDGKTLYTIPTSFTGAVNSLAFAPGGQILASGHYDGTIRLWDAASGELVRVLDASALGLASPVWSLGPITSLAFNPAGDVLAAGSSYSSDLVLLWDVGGGALLRALEGHPHAVDNLVFSPDGQVLVSASYDGLLRAWGVRP